MLQDSGHIQESDILYVNKKRKRRGKSRMDPLYTLNDYLEFAPIFGAGKIQSKI